MKHTNIFHIILGFIVTTHLSVAAASDNSVHDSTSIAPPAITIGITTVLASGIMASVNVPENVGITYPTRLPSNLRCNPTDTHPKLELSVSSGTSSSGVVDAIFLDGRLTPNYDILFDNTRLQRYNAVSGYSSSPIGVSWTIYCVPN